jgi:hypothetical protein
MFEGTKLQTLSEGMLSSELSDHTSKTSSKDSHFDATRASRIRDSTIEPFTLLIIWKLKPNKDRVSHKKHNH